MMRVDKMVNIELKGIALLVLVILIVIAYLALTSAPANLSTRATVSLEKNQSYNFYLSGDNNVSSVMVQYTSPSNATLYIGHMPLLLDNIIVLHLSDGKSDNVSLKETQIADLNVALQSSSSSSATLLLTYLPSAFGVGVTPGLKYLSITGLEQLAPTSTVSQASGGAGSVTTTKGTTVSTTTVAPKNSSVAALQQINSSNLGQMVVGYNNLFERQFKSCTQSTYDSEFATQYGMVPSGSLSFYNATLQVPQKMTSSVKPINNDIYNITYYEFSGTGSRKFGAVSYNLTGQFIVTSVFNGDFGKSYSAVLENYTVLNKSTDNCATFGV